MKYFTNLLFVFVLSFQSSNSNAVAIDTNQTSILVTENVKDQLILKQAFAQILVKNTGEDIQSIINNPIFKQAKINDGIKRSYFERVDSEQISDESPYQFWFHLVMNQEYIDNVIHLADFSLWPKDRYKIMIWPVELNDENELSYANENQTLIYWLQRWAQAFGLIIVFPSEEDLLINPESIKNLEEQAIEHSLQKYNIQYNLLVYINEDDEKIKIRTGFFSPQEDVKIKHLQEEIESKVSIFYTMMSELTLNYSNHYSIKPSQLFPHTQQIRIASIYNYDNILRLNNYFNNLSVIDTYEIIKASNSELIIRAELKVNNEAFVTIINRGDLLEEADDFSIHQLTFNIKHQ